MDLGRERHGLRSFSVSGRVARPGVHLAPAGISLRELVDEYCGGMLPGHELYGYFPGGASGGILPAALGDRHPVSLPDLDHAPAREFTRKVQRATNVPRLGGGCG